MDSDKGIPGLLGPIVRNFVLFLYALFALFPLVWMVILSLQAGRADVYDDLHFFAHAGELSCGAGAGGILRALWNNLVVSSLAVSLALIVGVPAAYALGRYQFKGRRNRLHLSLASDLPPEVLVIIPLYLIYQKLWPD